MRIYSNLALALGTAVVVYLIVMVAAWVEIGPELLLYKRKWDANASVGTLVTILTMDLESYRQDSGNDPKSVNDLLAFKSVDLRLQIPYLPSNANGELLDPWGQPFRYALEGDRIIAWTLGRDGTAGGTGPDADLYSDRRRRGTRMASFHQFLTECNQAEIANLGFHLDAILTGGVVAFIVFWNLGVRSTTRENTKLRDRVIRVGVFAALALGTGIALLALHIPNGH
jgi:hypothetical protein